MSHDAERQEQARGEHYSRRSGSPGMELPGNSGSSIDATSLHADEDQDPTIAQRARQLRIVAEMLKALVRPV